MPTYFGGVGSGAQVRLSRPTDVNKLTSLDLKCYEYPLDFDEWREFLKGINDTSRVVILELGSLSIGFAAWELVEPKNDEDKSESFVQVTRLGVLPEYRRKGYGRMLLSSIEDGARKLRADKVVLLIPEIHCFPGHPDDVSQLLKSCGYKATGVIEYNYEKMYGGMVDAYYFGKELL